jgi:hypothetical protein
VGHAVGKRNQYTRKQAACIQKTSARLSRFDRPDRDHFEVQDRTVFCERL